MKVKILRDNFNFSKTIYLLKSESRCCQLFFLKILPNVSFLPRFRKKRTRFDLKRSDVVVKYSATVKTQRRFTT